MRMPPRYLWAVLGALNISLVGCQNYTTQPLCNEKNTVELPGVSGTYTVTTQSDELVVETANIEVSQDPQSRTLKITSATGETNESRICQVAGHLINEAFDHEANGYQQARLYLTGTSLTLLPFIYDRKRLEAAGIPSTPIELSVKDFMGQASVAASKSRLTRFIDSSLIGLHIDNQQVDAEVLMSASHASPVGLTLLRQ